ncbi:hypothetical protein Ae201684_018544 [Aphanomyces euteiches]|uniref:Uncharacterized protein n=1 Tax=Aphanomyces euteiches TaxID=100861 RepID=A0A6G0W813_9STRA|nr:hypothetical protein Ae201684_018544 [Aphanomyces euteiches]KAH9155054.1 hypothetical protein AeRB84_002951 [Aphanomyces euteiches]
MTGDRMPWHLFGLVFLIHAASLWTGEWEFIFSFDDGANFLENDMIQELSLSNLIEMTTAVKINVYEPLAWMLKAMVHAICGMESRYVRLVSLALHWSACAMWSQATKCLLDQLFEDAPSILECSLAAILYGVQPLHIESTIWPSAQPYPLAMLFTSICFWAFIHPTWPASKAIAPAAYLCAVLSKSIALFLPVGLVMIDFVLENIQFNAKPADYFRYCRRIASIILIFVCMLAITINANQGGVGEDVDTITLTLSERIAKMFIVFIWPLQALIWPVGLRPHYRVREVDLDVSSNADVLLSVAATFMISLSLLLWRRKLFAAWIYYIAMLLPVSGLVQHGMVSLTADRYAYFPTVVFIPMSALCLRRWHITQVVLVFALLLGLTLQQMQHWRREEDLWQYCITQDPADWRMLDQLAEYYLHYRRNAEAVPLMERSAWFGPKRGFKAQLFQAKQRMLLNFVDEGCAMYDSLAIAFPQSAQVWNNLAVCRLYKGEPDVAREMWETAMQLEPPVKSDLSIPWNNLRQLDDYLHKQSGFRAQLMW